MTCIFCDIVAGREQAEVIRQATSSVIITPLNPVTLGHVIVISHAHVPDYTSNPDVTQHLMWDAARYANQMGAASNLITSAGVAATQTVFHLHVHVVPRREGDGLALPWTTKETTS